MVNESGYLRLNDFCTEYILTQCCLHYLNQTHQKLGDLKEKLGCFSWKSVSVTFLDFSFYHNFSFCCVFFMPLELALACSTRNFIKRIHAPSPHPVRCDISVTRTENKLQDIKITPKLKSEYRVNHSNLAVFEWIFAHKMAKYTILNNKKKLCPAYCESSLW